MANNGTTGHETEAINVQGLKASLQKFKGKMSTLYADKAAVEELQQQVAERYQVTVTGHTCVFGNNAIVTGHKLVLT